MDYLSPYIFQDAKLNQIEYRQLITYHTSQREQKGVKPKFTRKITGVRS